MPPLAPPNGTSTTAHLKVIRVAKACTSSISTSSLYLIPLKYKLIHSCITMENQKLFHFIANLFLNHSNCFIESHLKYHYRC